MRLFPELHGKPRLFPDLRWNFPELAVLPQNKPFIVSYLMGKGVSLDFSTPELRKKSHGELSSVLRGGDPRLQTGGGSRASFLLVLSGNRLTYHPGPPRHPRQPLAVGETAPLGQPLVRAIGMQADRSLDAIYAPNSTEAITRVPHQGATLPSQRAHAPIRGASPALRWLQPM
jgi:hypothetical protein